MPGKGERAGRVRSFAPVAKGDARMLVLGSMPGEESLRRREYYAHPRNAFWRIAGALWGFDAAAPYAERLEALKRARVALWDVLGSCRRKGSLDADIEDAVPNDLPGLLAKCPEVRLIGCNGGAAFAALKRHFPDLGIPAVRLPSTSPAAAMWTPSRKLEMWRAALCGAGGARWGVRRGEHGEKCPPDAESACLSAAKRA